MGLFDTVDTSDDLDMHALTAVLQASRSAADRSQRTPEAADGWSSEDLVRVASVTAS